jgi:hypothetical protein
MIESAFTTALAGALTKGHGFGLAILESFNDAGTFGAFGFLGAYFLISLAAPAYLRHRGQLGGNELVTALISVILLMVPAVGSVYPVPAWPVNMFPYIFLGYLAIGVTWFLILRRRPEFVRLISDRIHAEHKAIEAAVTAVSAREVKQQKAVVA